MRLFKIGIFLPVIFGCFIGAAMMPIYDGEDPGEVISGEMEVNGGPAGPVDMAYATRTGRLYIAAAKGQRVDVLHWGNRGLEAPIQLPDSPNRLLLGMDQEHLWISVGIKTGKLLCYDLATRELIAEVKAGHSPGAMVETGDYIVVCNRFPGYLTLVNKKTCKIEGLIDVGREPVALVHLASRNQVIVAHHLPEMAAIDPLLAASLSVVDLSARKVTRKIALPNGSTDIRDLHLGGEGKHLFVSHLLARYNLPTTQLERGWMSTNALSIVRTEHMEDCTTILLDDIDHGAANPWALGSSREGDKLFVTHAGTHEVSIIRWDSLQQALNTGYPDGHRYSLKENLGFIYPYRERVPLSGNGPRTLCVLEDNLVIANYFTDNLDIINLEDRTLSSLELGTPDSSEEFTGERIFHDATYCFQSWQSCASCHPDARVDGLNWDLLNDGIGNPKNTKSMLFSHATPPVMSLGVRPDAETAVRAGFQYIQFFAVHDSMARKVDSYLRSLKPVSSPFRTKKSRWKAGKRLFHDLNCTGCHPEGYYTDLQAYSFDADPALRWDTPGLGELWRTAPYWHDGRYYTLEELFRVEEHGLRVPLDSEEMEALVAYLLSL